MALYSKLLYQLKLELIDLVGNRSLSKSKTEVSFIEPRKVKMKRSTAIHNSNPN